MKVESLPYPGRAVCSGRGQTENLDVLMLGDVQIGEWVLAWNGMGTKKITEERARQVDAALDARRRCIRRYRRQYRQVASAPPSPTR